MGGVAADAGIDHIIINQIESDQRTFQNGKEKIQSLHFNLRSVSVTFGPTGHDYDKRIARAELLVNNFFKAMLVFLLDRIKWCLYTLTMETKLLNKVRLRDARLAVGMSRAHLAWLLGITVQAVGQLETGQIQPHLQTALRMSKVFGRELVWFFTEDCSTDRDGTADRAGGNN